MANRSLGRSTRTTLSALLDRVTLVKILVIGSGAREHAIVTALQRDPDVEAVIAAPGNPGIALTASCLPGVSDITDASAIVSAARDHEVDLVVVGPEAPLVAGVADAVREAGFSCFGPSAAASHLEGSKAFAKEVMAAAEVPTARAYVCNDDDELGNAMDATGAPFVIKDDGLAAGKGVIVTNDEREAVAHGQSCLSKPSGTVVVEEYLDGPEVSLFCLTDGDRVVPLAPAQDFKRLLDGDAGPNTGGMGAYSPLPWLEDVAPDLTQLVLDRVAQPTIDEMRRREAPFVGILYVGLALTARGPRVIEFNARFGDPETQSILQRLKTPLGGLLLAAAEGRLSEEAPLTWRDDASVTVVLASEGYPAAPVKGATITGWKEAGEPEHTDVLHAGTQLNDSLELVANGGRVLSVTSYGRDLSEARTRAYSGIEKISMAGGQFRSDIASVAAQGGVSGPGSASVSPATQAGMDRDLSLPHHLPLYSGKVRELYAPIDAHSGIVDESALLLVASDRISAYDFVLDNLIPDKGTILTQMSLWWNEQLADLAPDHVISTDVPAAVTGRGVYVRRLRMLPIEAIARSYLTGGGLKEYQASGSVSGVQLPDGLEDGSQLPEPIFTPSTKASAGEHDEPMSFEQVSELLGEPLAIRVRDLTIAILARANEIASKRGILIADTKVEFGINSASLNLDIDDPIDWKALDVDDVELILADEVLTPDSSRFWRADAWAPGHPQKSYDKQVLRDWLTSDASGWDRASGELPPPLPDKVVHLTRARYLEAYEALTGRSFEVPPSA